MGLYRTIGHGTTLLHSTVLWDLLLGDNLGIWYTLQKHPKTCNETGQYAYSWRREFGVGLPKGLGLQIQDLDLQPFSKYEPELTCCVEDLLLGKYTPGGTKSPMT